MLIDRLSMSTTCELSTRPVTFDAADPGGLSGFRRFGVSRPLERHDFQGVTDDLFTWRVHARAGVRVRSSDAQARAGGLVVLSLPGILAPCRVMAVVDEPRRQGFTYATLAGHPEQGQETFTVELLDDGLVSLRVEVVSRASSRLARLGGPVTRFVQDVMTRRYLTAPDRLPPRAHGTPGAPIAPAQEG